MNRPLRNGGLKKSMHLTRSIREQSSLKGLSLIRALLEKLIDDTANYPRVMARLTNATILGGESGRVGEIERLIARHYEIEFGKFTPDASVSPELLAQMTLGLYYGQVNHLLAYGLPFEAQKMRSDMRAMLDCLLNCRCFAKTNA